MDVDVRRRADAGAGSLRTTGRQDLVTVILVAWMTGGAFIDGFAHRNLTTPETFFTPWHAILYSGYLAAVSWLAWLVIERRPHAPSLRKAVPGGYETSLLGVLVFAGGGVGDMVWHAIFGIETSIDALLSPTHLMLLMGSLLMVSGPLRARWTDGRYSPQTPGSFSPIILAITVIAAELGFFFQYVDGFASRFMGAPYLPGLEQGYFQVVAGVSSILITTVIVMGPLLFVMRRWVLPAGTGIIYFGLVGMLMAGLDGFDSLDRLAAPLAGGLVADALIASLRPRPQRIGAVRLFAFLVPVVMWTVRFGVFGFAAIKWPVEISSGAVIFCGLASVGLSLLAFPGLRTPNDETPVGESETPVEAERGMSG